jgi:hypothetical protein
MEKKYKYYKYFLLSIFTISVSIALIFNQNLSYLDKLFFGLVFGFFGGYFLSNLLNYYLEHAKNGKEI